MIIPDAESIAQARSIVLAALGEAHAKHAGRGFEPYEFGAEVSPLVNAYAALAILEKEEPSEPAEESSPED